MCHERPSGSAPHERGGDPAREAVVGDVEGREAAAERFCHDQRPPVGREQAKLDRHVLRRHALLREAVHDELLPGTLEMLILKTLSIEPMHGYGIARRIEQTQRAAEASAPRASRGSGDPLVVLARADEDLPHLEQTDVVKRPARRSSPGSRSTTSGAGRALGVRADRLYLLAETCVERRAM